MASIYGDQSPFFGDWRRRAVGVLSRREAERGLSVDGPVSSFSKISSAHHHMARKITPSGVGSLCSLLFAVTACGTASTNDAHNTGGSGGSDTSTGTAGTETAGSATAAGTTGVGGSATGAGGGATGGDNNGGASAAGTSAGGASGGAGNMAGSAGQGPTGVSVLTNRYDNQRSGSNTHETVLNASNVNKDKFGLLYTRSVDGQMYSQPLYVHGLAFSDGTTRDVVFAATMHNSVYAFDVAGTQDKPIWTKNLGASGPVNGFGCTDMHARSRLRLDAGDRP